MTNNANTQGDPKFYFSMPIDKAPEAAKALKKLGVDLNPQRDMIVLGHTDTMNDEANGHDANNIRECINDYLEDHRISPKIPKGRLNLHQLHDLLRMAHSEFYWHHFNSATQLAQERPWSETIRTYPHLFPEPGEPQETKKPQKPPHVCTDCGEPATIYDTVGEEHYCHDCAGDLAVDRVTDDGEFTPA